MIVLLRQHNVSQYHELKNKYKRKINSSLPQGGNLKPLNLYRIDYEREETCLTQHEPNVLIRRDE